MDSKDTGLGSVKLLKLEAITIESKGKNSKMEFLPLYSYIT